MVYMMGTNCKYCVSKEVNDVVTEELCGHPDRQIKRSKWNPIRWFWGSKQPCLITGTKKFNTYCTLQDPKYPRPAPPENIRRRAF